MVVSIAYRRIDPDEEAINVEIKVITQSIVNLNVKLF